MPESVKRRGSSGPTTGATERSVAVSLSSMAMRGGYPRPAAADGARCAALPPVDALAAAVDAPRAGGGRRGAGGARRSAAPSCWRARRTRPTSARGRGRGRATRAAVAAARAQRDRRDRAHEPRARAAGGGGARGGGARGARATRTSSWDLATGARGSRHAHVEALLRELTGAEAALAVNNGAGAALLAAAALAGPGREVVVSRGQLVEIGGGFRVPEVIAQAGARLVEVGTTNRTRLRRLRARARRPDTGAILRAHPSNFRQLGFVAGGARSRSCASSACR